MNSTPDEGENLHDEDDATAKVEGTALEAHVALEEADDIPEITNADVESPLNAPPDTPDDNALRSAQHVNVNINGNADDFHDDTETLPAILQEALSNDESFSNPDDTPSVRDDILSSPRSGTPSIRSPARKGSPSSVHRPFDIRFQSRLSSFQGSPLRSASPAFLGAHSRHSSVASFAFQAPSEPDEPTQPWDVIRWSKFKRIAGQAFSELGRRNFGNPTCLAASDQLVIGTSKGIILVFDHQQNHKAIIGSGTKAAESGAVTSLAISADHTTVAVGHATGHIFTWELAKSARPFLHIPPIDNSQPQARRHDGHIDGSAVPHIGFLGYRHTALVSADDKGMAFSHLATRGMGAVSRIVKTTRILGRYPEVVARTAKPLKKSSVLAFSPLPLGNIEQRTDGMGLVAMLTPYLLVIVSTTPVAQTQHKAARPKEVAAHSAMTAALAWFPAIKLKSNSEVSKTKLAYAWSDILTVLDVHEAPVVNEADKDKPPELQFLARSRFQSQEAIVAVQWLNRSVMAVLTITQQLLILEDFTMHVTESFDLLNKNIYHMDLYSQQLQAIIEQLDEEDTSMHGVVADAFHMSFRAYKGRLFLLGSNDIWTGALTNWADRLLALMNVGDFIGAIRLATRYYMGQGEKATIGLPEEDRFREDIVKDKLSEMMTASLKFAFGKNQQAGNEPVEKSQMLELADSCIKACLVMEDRDFLFDEVFGWYEDHDNGNLFVDVLEPYIMDHTVTSLPPPALKTLINHFSTTHSPSVLEEIICMLDVSTMDIDQVTNLCKRYNLYEAYVYVWTMALRDFVTPLTLLVDFADVQQTSNYGDYSAVEQYSIAQKVFAYISFILTSRVYPTGTFMSEEESRHAKTQVYEYFFAGHASSNGAVKQGRGRTGTEKIGSFHELVRILHFDAANFIAAMNEAFEDSFLNTSDDESANDPSTAQPTGRTFTRQYIVRVMLDVMAVGFEPEERIYLDMFIARNLAKYPQYLVFSGTVLQEILRRLCSYPDDGMRTDAQLSVEYLLSIYQPPNILEFVALFTEARFYRVLKTVFKQEQEYAHMINTYFLDIEDQDDVFSAIAECLRSGSPLTQQHRIEVRKVIEEHAGDLANIDVRRTASTIDEVADDMHQVFVGVLSEDEYGQYEYLKVLLEPDDGLQRRREYTSNVMELYVRLLCQFDPTHVKEYVENINDRQIRLEEVLPTIEDSGIIDAVVILQVRQGQVKEAMERLNRHLFFLGSTLHGLQQSSLDDDNRSIDHPVDGLLESIDKYARVGIWLCQGQMKNGPKATAVSKSSRRATSTNQPLSFEETLWLDLVNSVVHIAREASMKSPTEDAGEQSMEITESLRKTIQEVFTALLVSTTSGRNSHSGRDMMFLRILRAFLTHVAEASPSLSELRNVIGSIFSAYAYEESLLSLSNSMLDKDVFVNLDEVAALRQRGWRPRGQVCEICRKRAWGPSIGDRVWEEWQRREDARLQRRRRSREDTETESLPENRGKGKAAADTIAQGADERDNAVVPTTQHPGTLVVFSCRHLYHQKCLGPGQVEDGSAQLVCPACK